MSRRPWRYDVPSGRSRGGTLSANQARAIAASAQHVVGDFAPCWRSVRDRSGVWFPDSADRDDARDIDARVLVPKLITRRRLGDSRRRKS